MDDDALPMTFVLPDREMVFIEGIDVLPQVGDGIYREGVAYRVRDIWLMEDDKTPLPYGWNVFLTLADDETNTLRDFAPDYFG
jgi:hypothetical protein